MFCFIQIYFVPLLLTQIVLPLGQESNHCHNGELYCSTALQGRAVCCALHSCGSSDDVTDVVEPQGVVAHYTHHVSKTHSPLLHTVGSLTGEKI